MNTLSSPVNPQAEAVLLTVLIQLVIIIAAARLVGVAFRFLGQPQVCGEIAAGLLLGPSFFGGFFPHAFARVFDPSTSPVFTILSQVGLILLMFLIGLEFDFGHLQQHRSTALSVSAAGIALPFALGFLLGRLIHAQLNLATNSTSFALFLATALSITAIPILGRIMIEFNIQRTKLGALTICAAAVDDATGWVLLALVTAIVRAQFDPARTALMVVEVLGYTLFMVVVARPLLRTWTQRMLRRNQGEVSLPALAGLLIMVFVSAAATNLIGIFSIFGGFVMGAILYDQQEFREAVFRRMRDFVVVFFLPIFFTYTGLRTDIGTMQGASLWALCGLVLLAAVVGKFGGCAAAARLMGLSWREASVVGIMMNTRGLMELIVINVGYDLGIISRNVFFMLVFMAVFTTYMTAPLLRRLIPKTELEPYFRASIFGQRDRWAKAESTAD